MADLLTYLQWRGDLSLAAAPFNEVDNLILAELSFVDFGGIVPPPGEGSAVPLQEAARRYFAAHPREEIHMGVLVPHQIPDLLEAMAESIRFRDTGLNCFADRLDPEASVQFAALTAELGDGSLYLSFRGTDDTIAGWRENFEMSFLDQVPAQQEAERYVEAVARQYRRKKLRLGGHSKGGNLAVYSAVHCPAAVQRRIAAVYNNDGPGFRTSFLDRPEHQRIAHRITTIVPQFSVVGLLMEHEEDYTVVKSSQAGLLQHDGFSWEVLGPGFVHLPSDAPTIRRNDAALKQWVDSLDTDQRRRFTQALFEVLTCTGAQTLQDLTEDSFKTAAAMLKTMAGLDKETRQALKEVVALLCKAQVLAMTDDIREDLAEGRRRSAKGKKPSGQE